MPDEPMNQMEDIEEESSPRPVRKKEKKKSRKGALLFLFLFLAAGTAIGLHAAGSWDARPVMYWTVPRIPWVGKNLASALGIPGEYSLTAEQRRTIELQRWNDRLNERERELEEREKLLAVVSADLGKRAAAVEKIEASQSAAQVKPPENAEEEKAYLDMLMKTYQEISPRKAALILEQLREDLAVKLLGAMPQDARASILGRMEAVRAARLTERLAAGGSR
jgi:flagellar motility protein MotE (MotC chaperone)